jgi:uncharacterized protein YggE
MTTVAVRGEAEREVEPELAEFTVVVSVRDKDRAATLARLRERADALHQFLDRFAESIERRETAGLHVYPETKGRGGRVEGYHGSVSTTVTVSDFSALGELMLSAAAQDQTQVHGPTWSLRPQSPVRAEARHDAVRDAISRAREYAAALGSELIDLLELADPGLITRSADTAPSVQSYGFSRAKFSGSAADLELDPQRQHVRATVEARFTITTPANL